MKVQENTKQMIKVVKISNHFNPNIKIVSLQFPDNLQPKIGMHLIDCNGLTWHISGVVFDIGRGDGVYDCQMEDEFHSLKIGSMLFPH